MAETMSGFGGGFCESHQEEPEEFRVATGREPVPPIDIADEVVSVGGGGRGQPAGAAEAPAEVRRTKGPSGRDDLSEKLFQDALVALERSLDANLALMGKTIARMTITGQAHAVDDLHIVHKRFGDRLLAFRAGTFDEAGWGEIREAGWSAEDAGGSGLRSR